MSSQAESIEKKTKKNCAARGKFRLGENVFKWRKSGKRVKGGKAEKRVKGGKAEKMVKGEKKDKTRRRVKYGISSLTISTTTTVYFN